MPKSKKQRWQSDNERALQHMHYRNLDHIAWLRRQGEIKDARIAELEAEVEKLPVLADGVAATPYMEVYLPGCNYAGEIEFVGSEVFVLVSQGADWPQSMNGDFNGFFFYHSTELYSTLEAARKAGA